MLINVNPFKMFVLIVLCVSYTKTLHFDLLTVVFFGKFGVL